MLSMALMCTIVLSLAEWAEENGYAMRRATRAPTKRATPHCMIVKGEVTLDFAVPVLLHEGNETGKRDTVKLVFIPEPPGTNPLEEVEGEDAVSSHLDFHEVRAIVLARAFADAEFDADVVDPVRFRILTISACTAVHSDLVKYPKADGVHDVFREAYVCKGSRQCCRTHAVEVEVADDGTLALDES